MEKEGVWMALPIAIVEDQAADARRLEELLQQQLPAAECTWFTCGDDFLRAKNGFFPSAGLHFLVRHLRFFVCLGTRDGGKKDE